MIPWPKYQKYEYRPPRDHRRSPVVTFLLMLAAVALAVWAGRSLGVSAWLYVPLSGVLGGVVVIRRNA